MKTAVAAIREEEIRPDDVFGEFMALSAADAENFFDRAQFMDVPCPACGHAHMVDDFIKHTFHYGACAACGTVYVSPRPSPSEMLRYYAQSKSQAFWAEAVLKRSGAQRRASILLPALERIETLLAERGKNPARVLDVGAANGAFLSEWKSRHPAAQTIAIEPGQQAAEKCRATGATVFEGFLETEAGKPGAQGDLVTCFEVLEHVQEPAAFAHALYNVTAPGGLAVTTCLGIDGFDIQLMWEQSRSLMPPYHLNFLSAQGMETMFKKAGFSKVEILTPGRLDVEIVQRALERGLNLELSRFEKSLLARGPETLQAFQKFLADHGLSSHVWIICHRS